MTRLGLYTLYSTAFLHSFSLIWASTHWVVTEDGRIQAQADSVYNLKRPHDLVALIKQEERLVKLKKLKDDLVAKRDYIDRSDEKDSGLEQRFYKEDKDCVAAERPLPEFDLFISTVLPLENKGIRSEEYIDVKSGPPAAELSVPMCAEVVELDYSVHAFEHLESMQKRDNLTGAPELGLKNAITHRDDVDSYGHLVSEALKQNRTSWVLYNMAAFFWRIKGSAYQAVECLRRALHYSPRAHRDVALISLANILHRSRYSSEAVAVVGAALDVSWDLNVNHFTLGNIFAVLTQYSRAVECFDNTLKIQPDFEAAAKLRHAVLCHAKLEAALEEQHRSLQQTLEELKEYQKKHETMQQMNEKLLLEQAVPEDRQTSSQAFDEMSRRRAQEGMMGEVCYYTMMDGRQVLTCTWEVATPEADSRDEFDSPNGAAAAYKSRSSAAEGAGESSLKGNNKAGLRSDYYSQPVQPPLFKARAEELAKLQQQQPSTVASDRGASDDELDGSEVHRSPPPLHSSPAWPHREECEKHVAKYPHWTEYPTTYLPLENKGYDTQILLTEAIDLESGEEHPLPWYPPICLGLVEQKLGNTSWDHLSAIKDLEKLPHRAKDTSVKHVLLGWVNEGASTVEEVGQRIFTALKQSVAPRWLLYNLAGLYWRVVGNMYHGVECLRRSLRLAPSEYVDLPLVNLANVLYKLGKLDEALNLTKQALLVADYEPVTHFMHGNLLAAKGDDSGAISHYERALALDATLSEAVDQLRIVKCYAKFQKASQSEMPKDTCAGTSNKLKDGGGVAAAGGVCVSATSPTAKACEVTARYVVPMCGNRAALQGDEAGVAYATLLNQGKSISSLRYLRSEDVETVRELYRQNGLCKGSECNHIVHQPGTRPHIKLYVDDGVWNQRLLFTTTSGELGIKQNECYLLSDGTRTEGCAQEPFMSHEDKLKQLEDVLKELSGFVASQEAAASLDDDEVRDIMGDGSVIDASSLYADVESVRAKECEHGPGGHCALYSSCQAESGHTDFTGSCQIALP